MRALVFGLPACVLLAVGCTPKPPRYGTAKFTELAPPVTTNPAETDSITDTAIFPMVVGDTWNYEFTTEVDGNPQGSPIECQVVVKKSEQTANGELATLDVSYDGQPGDRQVWLNAPDGLYEISSTLKDVPFSPRQTVLEVPYKPGDAFDWSGSGITPDGTPGTLKVRSFVRNTERVDTGVEKMNALPVESHIEFESKKGTGRAVSTIYLFPGVGMVRFSQTINQGKSIIIQTLRLKSHSLKAQ